MGIFDRLAAELGDLIAPDDVRLHVEQGAALLESGQLEAAVRALDRAVALKPDHARGQYLLGLARARLGDLAAAEQALGRAVEARPSFAEAWLALGEARRRREDLDGAVESFRRALEAGLGEALARGEACRGLGASYLGLGRPDRAVRELRKAVAEQPGDVEAAALLGRALVRRGDVAAARRHLEKAIDAPAAPTDAWCRALCDLGEIERQEGRLDEARAAFERALAVDDRQIDARLGLAEVELQRGRAAEAHRHALVALEVTPTSPRALAAVGRALAAASSAEAALGFYDQALALADPLGKREIGAEAMRLALRAGSPRAAHYAHALADDPALPADTAADASAAQALDLRAQGKADEARALLERSAPSLEVLLARAQLARDRGDDRDAASWLEQVLSLRPDDERARQRLAELAPVEVPPANLPSLARGLHRLLLRLAPDLPELAELGLECGRLIELLDRPLVVVVMGEFNAGKSTFVNALLGEEVAPMGITPTTATLLWVKHGRAPACRVVEQDDTLRDVAWGDVAALLRAVDRHTAARIRWVEVLYPLETLERVNLIDTPGLNSVLPEHEATARKFITEADAVVWLFSADQAGKQTEKAALAALRGERKRVLGVLNKIDRLAPGEAAQLLDTLRRDLGDLIEALVPFAAREALAGRHDPVRLARANLAELERLLEERFFAQAKTIQRDAVVRRLDALLGSALELAAAQRGPDRSAAIEAARRSLVEERAAWDRFLREERLRLSSELAALHAAMAAEVLEFVRPRRWAFGANEASPADRDFLLGLAEAEIAQLARRSRDRAGTQLESTFALLETPDVSRRLDEALRALDEQVYGRLRAFARGQLRGGRVDEFFTRALPKLDLGEAALRHALERALPDQETLDAELLAPLRAWVASELEQLEQRLRQRATREEVRRWRLEQRLREPLTAYRDTLRALDGGCGDDDRRL